MVEENALKFNKEEKSCDYDEINPDSISKILDFINCKNLFGLKEKKVRNIIFSQLLNESFLSNMLNSKKSIDVCQKNKPLHNGPVNVLCKLRDNRILSGSNDKSIIVSTLLGEYLLPMAELKGHDYSVFSLSELSNRNVVSGDFMGFLIVWEISNFNLVKKIRPHKRMISKIVDINNNSFASCSYDTLINIYNYNFEITYVINENSEKIYNMVESKEEHILVTCSSDSKLMLFSSKSYEKIKEIKEVEKYMYSIVITTKKDLMVSASNSIKIYDLCLNLKQIIKTNHCLSITCISELKSKTNSGKFLVTSNDKSYTVLNEDFSTSFVKEFQQKESITCSIEFNVDFILISSKDCSIATLSQRNLEEIRD